MGATERALTPPPAPEHAQHPAPGQNVGLWERRISTAAGGAIMAFGAMYRTLPSAMLGTLLGVPLIHRGLSGRCMIYKALGVDTAQAAGQPIKVEKSVVINRSAEELYGFWRNFENLPRFMEHLKSVKILDERRSHWVATGPMDSKIEWDAELIGDVPNRSIGWASLPGADVPNSGSVQFITLSEDRGTEVRVVLEYTPPAGKLGAQVARLFGEEPNQQVETDLRHFKQISEAGEVPTVCGQTSGRDEDCVENRQALPMETYEKRLRDEARENRAETLEDKVEVASDQSFPASDPPGGTSERSFT